MGEACGTIKQKGCDCKPPGSDHNSLWLKNGIPHVYASHPYSLSDAIMRKIADFASEHNLSVEVRADRAFYAPSTTFIVMYTKKEA